MRNNRKIGNKVINNSTKLLKLHLPSGWDVVSLKEPNEAPFNFGIEITASDKNSEMLAVCFRTDLTPRSTEDLCDEIDQRKDGREVLVVSPYLSPGVCISLQGSSINYLDFTGNIRVQLIAPALFLCLQGADKNPNGKKRPSRSLRGDKAGEIVRVLIESKELLGVREIAEKAKVDPGYVSRVLKLLNEQVLIERDKRGSLLSVDWQKLLRHWAEDAPIESRGESHLFLAARGLSSLVSKLKTCALPYAVTGSLAAAKIYPVAPARLATIYVEDYEQAASELELREVDAGANVLLIEAKEETIINEATNRDGVRYVSTIQVALDLLTGSGRSPAEAEELIEWMTNNEDKWRG